MSRKAAAKKVQAEEEEVDEVPEDDEEEENVEDDEEEDMPEDEEEAEEEAPVQPKKAKTAAKSKRAKRSKTAKGAAKATKGKKSEGKRRTFQILTNTVNPSIDESNLSKTARLDLAGTTPKTVASRAYRHIEKAGDAGCTSYVFSIEETTPGSAHKVFTYRGVTTKYDTPQTIERGGKPINIYAKRDVKAFRTEEGAQPESAPAPKKSRGAAKATKKAPKKAKVAKSKRAVKA